MNKIGTLETIWRYPVKGMRGEQLAEKWRGKNAQEKCALPAGHRIELCPGVPEDTDIGRCVGRLRRMNPRRLFKT